MLKIILIIVLLLAVVLLFAAHKLFTIAFLKTTNRAETMESDHNRIDTPEATLLQPVLDKKAEWVAKATEEMVSITSQDGLKLKGFSYSLAQPSKRWGILVHGFDSRHEEMFDKAPYFQDLGFNVLLPDLRAHGSSEGRYIGFGWPDRKDIQLWIDFILQKEPEAEIILYGVSMGGATVMMTAGENLPSNVKAVIEDCGYASVKEELSYQLKNLFHVPAFPLIPLVSVINKVRQGWWLGEASSTKQLAKTKLPALFIHGTADTFVPFGMLAENYQAAPTFKEKLPVAGAQHAMSGIIAGEAYWQKVKAFLDEVMA
ncbi:alpha/beta hydrolase [Enterococcus sp. LJL90]